MVTQIGRDQTNYILVSSRSPVTTDVVSTLPSAPGILIGRNDIADQLLDALAPAEDGPVAVQLSGLGGVGKTALALHVAQHAAAVRQWFSGGAIYVDFRGYEPGADLPADQAVGLVLEALKVPPDQMPGSVEARFGCYRSILAARAEQGRRLLLVADNVSSSAQIEPLLPTRREHRLLITSRDTIANVGARMIDLAQLAPADAVDVIATTLTQARPSDPRVANEPAEAALVAHRCGCLPLALQIAARILTADPGLKIGELADQLAAEQHRLSTLKYVEVSGQTITVQAVLETSYRRLAGEPRRLLRLLGVTPGLDVSTAGVAVLAQRTAQQARVALGTLTAASLLIEQPVGGGRWRLHDLVRLYAAQRAHQEARRPAAAAVQRLLTYYQAMALAADSMMQALPDQPTPQPFAQRSAALDWLTAEQPNLIAAVHFAAVHGLGSTAVSLALSVGTFLRQQRYLLDAVSTGRIAVDCARNIKHRTAEGMALTHLGRALSGMRRFDEALAAHELAIEAFHVAGDRQREGVAHDDLGVVLQGMRRFPEALAAHELALDLLRTEGDRDGETAALINLGNTLVEGMRFDEAIAIFEQAGTVFREVGDWRRLATAIRNLADSLHKAGRFNEALASARQAVESARAVGDRYLDAVTLDSLGVALMNARRYEEAVTAHRAAIKAFQELDEPHTLAIALTNLGVALQRGDRDRRSVRRFGEAIAAHREAAAIFQLTDDRHREAKAWGNLGNALQGVWQVEEAVAAHEHARLLFQETGDRHLEHIAADNLAKARAQARKPRWVRRLFSAVGRLSLEVVAENVD